MTTPDKLFVNMHVYGSSVMEGDWILDQGHVVQVLEKNFTDGDQWDFTAILKVYLPGGVLKAYEKIIGGSDEVMVIMLREKDSK